MLSIFDLRTNIMLASIARSCQKTTLGLGNGYRLFTTNVTNEADILDLENSSSDPIPSPTVMVVKVPANGSRKRGLWAAIRRFLRFGEWRCAILPLNYLVYSFRFPESIRRSGHTPVQQECADAPLSKVQLCEWRQYGYWAWPFLNGVECTNSGEFSFSIE